MTKVEEMLSPFALSCCFSLLSNNKSILSAVMDPSYFILSVWDSLVTVLSLMTMVGVSVSLQ